MKKKKTLDNLIRKMYLYTVYTYMLLYTIYEDCNDILYINYF